MDLLEHTARGAYDLNHVDCSKTGCRVWSQGAQANIKTRCIRGTHNTIADGNTVEGTTFGYWSPYSMCPAGSHAMGYSYMDLAGGGFDQINLNHQECTYH